MMRVTMDDIVMMRSTMVTHMHAHRDISHACAHIICMCTPHDAVRCHVIQVIPYDIKWHMSYHQMPYDACDAT